MLLARYVHNKLFLANKRLVICLSRQTFYRFLVLPLQIFLLVIHVHIMSISGTSKKLRFCKIRAQVVNDFFGDGSLRVLRASIRR